MSVLIQTQTGKANFSLGMTELYVFHTPRPAVDGRSAMEAFIGKSAQAARLKPNPAVRLSGNVVVVPSMTNYPEGHADIGGRTAFATYTVADGTILKLMARRRAGTWRAPMSTALQYVRVREGAPTVNITVPTGMDNHLAVEEYFLKGNFDLITLDEAEAFGASISIASRALAATRDPGVLFIEEVEAATEAAVEAVRVEGAEEPLIRARRVRRIEEV